MGDEGDVFQDFDSDASDADDDVDWSFTDGECASVLQLMGGAESNKKSQCCRADTVAFSPATNDSSRLTELLRSEECIKGNSVEEMSVISSADEDLLAELFPEAKAEPTNNSAAKETSSRIKECEVEWALMALEEHEQLGNRSESSSAVNADADFVSFCETTIAHSTLSPPTKPDSCRQVNFDSKQHNQNEALINDGDACLSRKIAVKAMANNIPSEALKMLQLVYMKAIETQLDFSSLLSETSSRLCLPDYDCQGQNAKSSFPLNMLVEATCFLEERLSSHDLVKSFASTQEERLELVLVAVDDKIGALPHSLKIKWAKTMDMLSLLSKMREQTSSPASAPKLVTEEPEGLVIDTTVSSVPTQLNNKKGSPLEGWATFHPEKMPVRRCEPKPKQPGHPSGTKKPRVQIRQYLPAKLRVRCKAYNPEDKELTFRPNINKKSSYNRKGGPRQQKENFTARMQEDISKRRSQKLQHEWEREQQDREEAASVLAATLIDKGSQRILLKNGMWAESLEERISRLAKHRTSIEDYDSRSKKRRQRYEQRKREATAIASRACESLYQRGIEQRKREQERLQEDLHDLEFQRNRPKISSRSVRVMKTRIRQELSQLCMDSRRTANADGLDHEVEETLDSPFVTFIQFSCALLYFGFVPDLNTPWDGSAGGGQGHEITLLWHSWAVFTRDHTGSPGPKLAKKVLERVLFSVIIGGRASEHKVLQGRDEQTLLRVYRANYYTRKHTQLRSEPSDDRKPNDVEVGAQSSGKKRNSCRQQRIRYTLHGKPIRGNGVPETDFLSEREHLLQEKLDQMREAKAKQELDGCTFHPHINPGPSEATVLRSHRQSSPPKEVRIPSATVSTFERLYSDAFQRQNNVLEKYLEAKQHREELEKRESKVHPSYVNGLTIEERLENLHVALAGNALPVDFHKKIGAMRNATEMKALDEQIKERKLLPAHFKRAKDGRIVVYPFQFATEIRAALSTDLKKLRTKPVHRPRDHVMKDLRPATYDREIPATVHPPQRKIHGRIEDTEADLCLDVHLSPSETRQLYLNMDDDPREVVDNFAKRFSLTNTQRHFLVQLVDARLGQFAT